MPVINFIQSDGSGQGIEATTGQSVMQVATHHAVSGILADCGGAMSCATCHVYIDPVWLPVVGAAGDIEEAMLECAIDPAPNSRLSCQITVDDRMDGLIILVPKRQI